MSKLRAGIAALVIFLSQGIALSAEGDKPSKAELEAELDYLQLASQVAEKQKALAVLEDAAATFKKSAAASRKAAAADLYEAAQTELKRNVPPITIKVGTLAVVSAGGPTCDATQYLRWKCNNEQKCDFTVNEAICGIPGASSDPMNLTFSYSCGKEQKDVSFRWGKPAYAGCN